MNNSISSTLEQKSQFVNPQSDLIYSSEKSPHLNHLGDLRHWTRDDFDLWQWARDDWHKSAAIELFDANVQVVDGLAALDKILVSDDLPRTKSGDMWCKSTGYGALKGKVLEKYDHLYDGGWFVPVLNPLADFADDFWGCLKPVEPRTYQDGIKLKTIKYEHPPKMPVQPFFLRVTARVWERIAQRHDVAMPELLPQTSYGREFWEWAIANNLPVVITEGAKKAASLLCAGYVAIGLPGIWNFSDTSDRSIAAYKTPLNPWLQSFFSRFQRLEITIAFDSDSRVSTALQVYSAACRLANKIIWPNREAVVKIAQWHPELGKGVDDIIVQNGIETLETVLNSALPLQVSRFRKKMGLTYPIIDVESRYLFNGMMPTNLSAKIVAVKSPKNTGKTYCLSHLVREATRSGKKVIVLGHRIQLMSHLCERFGVQFLNEIASKEDWLEASYFGLGLCINSLHPNSKAKIDLTVDNNFDNCILIIDECEQVLSHLLHADTKDIRKNRAEIMTQLEILCQNADKIYLADADLSDFSIDFFRKIADLGKPDVTVFENRYKFDESMAWDVFFYQENDPDRILAECQSLLQQGKRVFFLTASQGVDKLYSAQNLATRFSPYCQADVLVIDKKTVSNPNHPAYGIASNLGQLGNYQLVLSTPTLETGVSIESDFFDAVFYVGHGVQSVQSVAQFVARYRRPVNRHIWVKKCPGKYMKFNGALSSDQIAYYLETNKKRMQSFLKNIPTLDNGLKSAYCESVARNNLGLNNYRENIEYLLASDGHRCHYVDPVKTVDTEIRAIRGKAEDIDATKVDAKPNPDEKEYKVLDNKIAKTEEEQLSYRKGTLMRTYGYCSKELVKADNKGCFRPLQLLYYSTIGKAFTASHDAKQVQNFTSKTQCLDHEISKYAVTLRQLYLSGLFDMGLSRLLTGENFSKNDPFLTDVVAKLNPDEFVETFGRALPVKTGDRINAILDLIGYQKKYAGRVGTGADAIRHYYAVPKFDGIDMDQIFACWFDRDMKAQENSGTVAGDDSVAGDLVVSEVKLWSDIWDAVANDTFKDMWQKVKAMGAKITKMVFTELPELISQVDPNFALGDDFAGDFALA